MINIRRPNKSDFESLYQLEQEFTMNFNRGEILSGFQKEYVLYKNMDEQIQQTVEQYINSDIVFVAEQDSQIVGFIHGRIDERPNKVVENIGIIENWFVTKSQRNKGYGMKLFNHLIESFKSNNVGVLKVSVFADNRNTHQIYKNLGFTDFSIELIRPIS